VETEETVAPSSTPTSDAEVSTHGAGPGGRLAALALLAVVLGTGLLVLYWGIKR
jgi:hypothetical protein